MKLLLFHVFPINNWKIVTEKLLSEVPHDDIFIHVSLPHSQSEEKREIDHFLRSLKKIRTIFYSLNSAHPESDAMLKFLEHLDLSGYSILTYMHTKGVTKPDNQNIKDWTELMRYYIVDKMSLCQRTFESGYLLYGVNRIDKSDFEDAEFFYAGNFVSVNLVPEMIRKINSTPMAKEYHGLEGFWGKLCTNKQAYNAFYSRIDHYTNPFPASLYKNQRSRIRYSIVSFLYHNYYRLRHFLLRTPILKLLKII